MCTSQQLATNSKRAECSHRLRQIGMCEKREAAVLEAMKCVVVQKFMLLLQRSQHNVMADRLQIRVGLASPPILEAQRQVLAVATK